MQTDLKDKFDLYCDLILEWNNKFNLTAITDRDEIYLKHFKDSLLGAEFIKGKSVLDIGSGAGFPALPLALANADKQFTLVDSLNKRVGFLNEAITALGLSNATAYHCRAEDLKKDALYDTVTARAVAPLNILAEYCMPFVKVGGVMLAYKGLEADNEVAAAEKAIKILGGGKVTVAHKPLNEEITRAFIVIEKVRETPSKYPRGGNKPRTEPL